MTGPIPRRSFLGGTIGGILTAITKPFSGMLPTPKPWPVAAMGDSIRLPSKPWGIAEVFTASGKTRLARLEIPVSPWLETGKFELPPCTATAENSGAPSFMRVSRLDDDGAVEFVRDIPTGIGEGHIAFNSSFASGGTVCIGPHPFGPRSCGDFDEDELDDFDLDEFVESMGWL